MTRYPLFLFLCLLLSALSTLAHPASAEENGKPASERRWDKRTHVQYEGWERLRPKHAKLQYAGGMGFLSLGVGWDYGRRCQWETDLFIGFLQAKYAGKTRLTFTLKQNYIPWSVSLHPRWSVEPFYCGMYINTITGEEFWQREPGKYPNKYYNFSTKIRPYLFVGQRMTLHTPKGPFHSATLFYEISSCEFYLISKFTNRSLRAKDYLRLSFGIKLPFKEARP